VRNVIKPTSFQPLSVSAMSSIDDLMTDEDEDDEPEGDYIVSPDELDSVDETFGPSDKFVHATNVNAIRQKYKRSENDSGSPEFQIAGFTERITYLTAHLKVHPKDFSTRRGLVALVNKRRRILNFLFKEDIDRYRTIVAALGVRHKAPGRVMSKEDKYGRYPRAKKRKD